LIFKTKLVNQKTKNKNNYKSTAGTNFRFKEIKISTIKLAANSFAVKTITGTNKK